MKVVQIIGLAITILAFSAYASFAGRIASGEESGSVTLGIGLLFVFLMVFTSAILLIPSSFMLWRKKTREHFQFNGALWNSLLVANSTLAIAYSVFGLWFAVTFVTVWLGSSPPY